MKLADVMDKVEVGMKMVVRSEYNPEYEVFGGKSCGEERRLFMSGSGWNPAWTVCERKL